MLAHSSKIVHAAGQHDPAVDTARLTFPNGWYLAAEISRETPRPVLAMWAQDTSGWPGGDCQLDVAGVDALLADLPRFAAQLRALRDQLAAETSGDAR
jgi:hypothetical protein